MDIILYLWADRRIGSGGERLIGPLGGRSIGFIVASVLGGALGYWAVGPFGLLFGLFWSFYRSLDFKHGALIPVNTKQRINAFLRHSLSMLLAVPAYWFGNPLVMLVCMGAYTIVATGLAIRLGIVGDKDNWLSEMIRGAAFGCAIVAYGLFY